jgi:hypothetical protein
MSDIIDINVGETIEEVTINVVDNLITVNINKVTGGGGDVASVNGETGIVVLNQDDVLDGTTYKQYSLTEKNKLAGIAAGAEVNVNADWNATTGDAQILNKPTIPDISTLVPYTGATADVDLDNNGLDAKFVKIKGTAGAGHLGLKHQSASITASGSESSLGADSVGNPVWKNDGNALQNILLNTNITQTITNGVTDKAPSEDAVFDALALKPDDLQVVLLSQVYS